MDIETRIIVLGAGTLEANGIYSKVQKNFMDDGSIALYDKDHDTHWADRWFVAYYPASTTYGPAWHIQQGNVSAYKAKLSKDPQEYPNMFSAPVPSTGWAVYEGPYAIKAVKPAPLVEKASDVKAAIALLEHLAGGKVLDKDTNSDTSVQITQKAAVECIIPLADEARRLKLPGTIVTEPLWEGAKNIAPFNEVRGPRGKPRPAYASVVDIIQKVMEEDRKTGQSRIDTFPTVSLKDFRGDNRLYHIPRMLTMAETDMLVKGIAQRARAIRAFVLDMNKSRGVEKMACVRDEALPEMVFRRIAARAAHMPAYDLVDKSKASSLYWNIWYGPDIIRGPDENGGYQFFVVEDNFGYVGGFGDLIESRKVLLKTFPELENAIGADLTGTFYDEMCQHYQAQVAPNEKVVVLYYSRRRGLAGASESADNEDKRMSLLFQKRGVTPVVLPGDDGPQPGMSRLEVRNKKVYLVSPRPNASSHTSRSPSPARKAANAEKSDGPPQKRHRPDDMLEEPVGLVILLSEPIDVQPGHASTKLRSAIENARAHIEEHMSTIEEEKLRAKGAEKSVSKVSSKVEVTDKEGCKNCLMMKGASLLWIAYDKKGKELHRIKGPLAWDVLKHKLWGSTSVEDQIYTCTFDAANVKILETALVLGDLTMEAAKAQAWVDDLKAAVERVGQLVGGRANEDAPEELFRLLRLHDKEGWQKLMFGKRGVPNLLEAYYAGGVKIANGPGFVLLDDKELCSHTDKLVSYYLNEEPILKTIPTRSFATDPELLQTVFDDPRTQENVVVKRVDGRGGDAVWVGAKISRTDFLQARPLAEAEPDAFLVQRYTALSQVDGQLVDLRGPAFLSSTNDALSGGQGVSVSPVIWGRGVPEKGGNGKVNISDAGFQLTVATSSDA